MPPRRRIVVTEDLDEKEATTIKQYTPDDDYYLYDYLMDCSKVVIEGETMEEADEKLSEFIMARVPRFFRIINREKRMYMAKLDIDNPFCYNLDIDRYGWYGKCKTNGIRTNYGNGNSRVEHLTAPFFFITNCNKITSQSIVDIPYHLDEGYSDTRNFNIFPGFKAKFIPNMTYEEAEAICEPLLSHINNVLADNWDNDKDEIYEYLLEWFMYPFRELKKTNIMITLIGPQGIGKTMVFDFLSKYVVGDHLMASITGLDNITGTFNSTLQSKFFLCVNETTEAGEAKGHSIKSAEILKEIITGAKTGVRKMRTDVFFVDNYINVALTTNSECPLIVRADDRRHFITETASTIPGVPEEDEKKEKGRNRRYYAKLLASFTQEMGNAFYTMARLSKAKVHLNNIPSTTARENAIEKSKPLGLLFFSEVFEIGTYPIAGPDIHKTSKGEVFIRTSDLYVLYIKWHKETNNGSLWSDNRFSKAVKALTYLEATARKAVAGSKSKQSSYIIPEDLYDVVTVVPLMDTEGITLREFLTRK